MHSRWLPHESGWENAKNVQSCHQSKGELLWRISIIRYILIFLYFFGYYKIPCVLFHTFIGYQTFDWYCVYIYMYMYIYICVCEFTVCRYDPALQSRVVSERVVLCCSLYCMADGGAAILHAVWRPSLQHTATDHLFSAFHTVRDELQHRKAQQGDPQPHQPCPRCEHSYKWTWSKVKTVSSFFPTSPS